MSVGCLEEKFYIDFVKGLKIGGLSEERYNWIKFRA